VEPSQEAEDAWVNRIISTADRSTTFFEECTPGYRNAEGQVEGSRSIKAIRNGLYGPGSIPFIKVLEDWRAEGKQTGLEFN
jgi:cyclohexanone monooxygenase